MIMVILTKIDVKLREKLNPYLGPLRKRKLSDGEIPFTVISNNCWGGHVYRYFNLPYSSPTVGMYFFADDYIKFLTNLKDYLSRELVIIPVESSHHYDEIRKYHKSSMKSPIGLLGDVEIVFLHCKTAEEAIIKWNRRKSRINMDNLIVKMSEMNGCTLKHLQAFDELPFKKKFVFTTKDYGLKSQVIFKEYIGCEEVADDTSKFRKYVDLVKLINGLPFKKNQ